MDVIHDIRVAARRLVREPIFAITAIVTLAIGIGANSAVFTLVNGVLLKPLPFRNAEELVEPHAVLRGEAAHIFSSPVFLALQEQGRAFADVALFTDTRTTIAGDGEPEQIAGSAVSANYFDVLGVNPLRGRLFRAEENDPAAAKVVLISESLWRDRFGADPGLVGRTVEINGRAHEVVGIMPANVSVPPEIRLWLPISYTESFRDPTNVLALSYNLVARLKPGVTLADASADVARVVELAKQAGDLEHPQYTGAVTPLQDFFVGSARTPLLILLGAVGLVLLIVCANLANLLLAQAASRTTDFAVRLSLGASSTQLIRQLLLESMVLGTVGGAAGLLLGIWASDAMIALLPPELPRMPDMGLDLAVVAFTFAISLTASLVFGLAPAWQARRTTLVTSLREGGRGLAGRAGGRTRAGLVLAETALAFALVIGAGLLIRSLGELRSVNPGFDPTNTLTFQLVLPTVRYEEDAQVTGYFDRTIERIQQVPGVEKVGAIQHLPLGGSDMTITFDVVGRPPAKPGEETVLDVRVATPGFFEAMGVPLKRGRLFTSGDRAGSLPVAILSESAVREHFPNEDPIGKRIVLGWTRDSTQVQGEVIGVVGDVRHGQLRVAGDPEIYFPHAQVPRLSMSLAVRTSGEPLALVRQVTEAVHEIDPGIAVAQVRAMTDVVAASVATDRFVTRLLTAFSSIALLLAAIGIFGVISYGVTQRRREIGVRMAVGASQREVLQLIVAGALRLAGGGIAIGLVAALGLTRVMRSLLFGVQPFDAPTFLVGGGVLLVAALGASLLPALTAARTPPATVLNTE